MDLLELLINTLKALRIGPNMQEAYMRAKYY